MIALFYQPIVSEIRRENQPNPSGAQRQGLVAKISYFLTLTGNDPGGLLLLTLFLLIAAEQSKRQVMEHVKNTVEVVLRTPWMHSSSSLSLFLPLGGRLLRLVLKIDSCSLLILPPSTMQASRNQGSWGARLWIIGGAMQKVNGM